MPRDPSGNMTLPPGNPVVTGTAISSAVHNATIADLAAEIQDSLSRSGKGGMNAPFPNADGNVSAPGITFTDETSTGWYRAGAGDLRAAILGVWRLAIKAAGLVLNPLSSSSSINVEGAGNTFALQTNSVTRVAISDTDVTISTTPVAASTSVATTNYVDVTSIVPATAAVTSVHANLSHVPSLAKVHGFVYFTGNPIIATGAIAGCSATGDYSGAAALFNIPTTYRPEASSMFPVYWYDHSAGVAKPGALVFSDIGNAYFFDYDLVAPNNLAADDRIYLPAGSLWRGNA